MVWESQDVGMPNASVNKVLPDGETFCWDFFRYCTTADHRNIPDVFLGDYISHSRTSRMGSADYSTEIISPD